MSHVRRELPRRSTGELYDAIWEADLPPIMDDGDARAPAVAEPVARLLLMALAKHTNPTRDQVLGRAREWQCFASVALLAELAGTTERQAQRVFRVLEAEKLAGNVGWIERLEQGRRPGRPRRGEQPGRGRPTRWCLRPDLWPRRELQNRGGIVAISNSDRNSLPVPEEVATEQTRLLANGAGAGRSNAEVVTGSVTLTRETINPSIDENSTFKPAHAATRAEKENGADFVGNAKADAHAVALPGLAVSELTAVSTPPAEPTWPCPNCHRPVTESGRGHAGGVDPCPYPGRPGHVERCASCGEWIALSNPRAWHATKCPVYLDLVTQDQPSYVDVKAEELPSASSYERQRLEREQELEEIARIEADLESQPTAEERMRARQAAESARKQVAV